jgi:hypothetical protein
MQVRNRAIASNRGSLLRHVVHAVALTLTLTIPAFSQDAVPLVAHTTSLSGPRFGLTFLDADIVDKLHDDAGLTVGSFISQFGWQFEKRFYSSASGPTAVTEWVLLLGGLDQGVALPSLSWLVGMRAKTGAEFGIGPNFTPLGAALAVAAGVTFRAGALNVPVNLAVVPSKSGMRVSVLAGFNTRR